MEKNSSLIDIIKKELYEELSNVEIIPYKDSIWFIDREKEYWYFEFDMSGTLWWRFHFFTSFFKIFSMNPDNFTPILSSWVEEVLNHRVSTTKANNLLAALMVEEVLNHKVSTTHHAHDVIPCAVEEVLNHRVSTTKNSNRLNLIRVENALKYKVDTTASKTSNRFIRVENALNHKVTTTQTGNAPPLSFVKDILNYKVTKTKRDSSIDWVNVEGC